MKKVNHAPSPDEPLADYINRNRPEPAPEIRGEPSFDPVHGFCWKQGGWTVSAAINKKGHASVDWHAPESMPTLGRYTLTAAGHREAIIFGTNFDAVGSQVAHTENTRYVDDWPTMIEEVKGTTTARVVNSSQSSREKGRAWLRSMVTVAVILTILNVSSTRGTAGEKVDVLLANLVGWAVICGVVYLAGRCYGYYRYRQDSLNQSIAGR